MVRVVSWIAMYQPTHAHAARKLPTCFQSTKENYNYDTALSFVSLLSDFEMVSPAFFTSVFLS
ncbi:MAG: hypothetical protein ABR568_23640, partial [Pyrinomonadaceae bacterium]